MTYDWQKDAPPAGWEEPPAVPWSLLYLVHVVLAFTFGYALAARNVPDAYRALVSVGSLAGLVWSAGPLIRRIRHGDRAVTRRESR